MVLPFSWPQPSARGSRVSASAQMEDDLSEVTTNLGVLQAPARRYVDKRGPAALATALVVASRPVSGILCTPRCAVAIHLCGLPERYRATCVSRRASRSSSLLGLAPSGVYRAVTVARHAGALLPHRCTLTCERLPVPSAVSLCCTVREVAPTWLAPALCSVESRLSSMASVRRRHRDHPADSLPGTRVPGRGPELSSLFQRAGSAVGLVVVDE